MTIRYPGESEEYRTARDRLLEREIELRRATEAVAAERRALPAGGVVPDDYVFQGKGTMATPLTFACRSSSRPARTRSSSTA
jgi:predicted dithiol-disulfide oxidoreductase (DUF899 family)